MPSFVREKTLHWHVTGARLNTWDVTLRVAAGATKRCHFGWSMPSLVTKPFYSVSFQ